MPPLVASAIRFHPPPRPPSPAPQLLELVPLADRVDKLAGRCKFCEQPSLFTLRIAASTQQALVGGEESYAPVCRDHYCRLDGVRNGALTEAEEEAGPGARA